MPRPHIEAIHYTDVNEEQVASGPFAGAAWHVLSRDDQDAGEFTAVARLAGGFSAEPGPERGYELFVLEGEVTVAGEPVATGRYAYVPAGSERRQVESTGGATVFIGFLREGNGGGDFVVVDPDTIPWNISITEGVKEAPTGRVVNIAKFLREDPTNDDVTGMSVMFPESNQDCAEWHEAADEGFMLRGDMLALDPDGEPTEMVPGSYNWRPSNARHLPKYSHRGNLRLFRATGGGGWSGKLVYDPEPRWPQMLAEYKAKHSYFQNGSLTQSA